MYRDTWEWNRGKVMFSLHPCPTPSQPLLRKFSFSFCPFPGKYRQSFRFIAWCRSRCFLSSIVVVLYIYIADAYRRVRPLSLTLPPLSQCRCFSECVFFFFFFFTNAYVYKGNNSKNLIPSSSSSSYFFFLPSPPSMSPLSLFFSLKNNLMGG